MITAVVALSVWSVLAVAACLAMHRARQAAPPPPPDPDATADDYHDDPSAFCPDCMVRREFVSMISAEWEWAE